VIILKNLGNRHGPPDIKKNHALPSSLSSFAENGMFSGLAESALVDFVALFLHNGVPWSVHLFAC